MKHKRHQKDRRDKSERYRLDDHRYFKSESNATSVKREHKVQQHYIMRDLSNNSGDENEPKKLIIYIVNMFFFHHLVFQRVCIAFDYLSSQFCY